MLVITGTISKIEETIKELLALMQAKTNKKVLLKDLAGLKNAKN